MSTSAQIAANQANAQHSTGPKSEAGKAVSSQNNFRHGLSGAFCVAEYEDREEYDALHLELAREYAPQTPTEEMLVGKMAQSYWLPPRARVANEMDGERSRREAGTGDTARALHALSNHA